MSETYVALLRGINVGGANKLPMKELAALFAAAGAKDGRTYIQSGNVVFKATGHVVAHLANTISEAIEEGFGLKVPVLLRSRAELEAVLDANPFVDRGSNPKAFHVMFLSDHPSDERVAALGPQRSPPDEFAVLGREVYLHCPKGIARSKLTTAWIDRALGTVATVRNWNTVNALVEMCRAS